MFSSTYIINGGLCEAFVLTSGLVLGHSYEHSSKHGPIALEEEGAWE